MASTHPMKAVLQRFARGEATRVEGKEVVAHLLHRPCERCAASIRKEAWLPSQPEDPDLWRLSRVFDRLSRRPHLRRVDAASPARPPGGSPRLGSR